MYRISIIILIIVVLVSIQAESQAQGLSSSNLATINVDDLSDEQILSYVKQAESSGYTEQQFEALARKRGMPESEIAKLRRRVEQLRFGGLPSRSTADIRIGERQRVIGDETEVFGKLANSESSRRLNEMQRKIFGFDLFQTDKLTFSPNLNIPTPEDYVIGPGDEIIVDLWGATQNYMSLKVNSEGYVRPENLSPVYVNGLNINVVEKRIISRLSEIYRGLKSTEGQNANIFYQVSLGSIRSINVTIVGEIRNPGNYTLNSLSTVYTALHAAGGPNEQGTFRNIQLIRDNQPLSTIDIYTFLKTGVQEGNVRLQNGDVIIVKPFETRVEVFGEVKRPGLFELKKGETLENLLTYSSGFTNEAYKSLVTVKRNGDKEREVLDVANSQFSTFGIKDGDIYKVSPILDRYKNRVQIEGAVYREGEYELTEGLTLNLLIGKADGIRGDAFLSRATIFRTNEDFTQDVIPVDLEKLINNEIPDIPLQKEDLIRVNSIYDLNEEYYVEIIGEVTEGGVFPFFNNMTVQDLIVLSGGLTEGASGSLIEIARRNKESNLNTASEIINVQIDKNLQLGSEDRDLTLQPFDKVYVRKNPGYSIQKQVTIEGEITAPGIYSISRKDERVSDIIRRAKGLTQYAYPEGAILVRITEFAQETPDDQITFKALEDLKEKISSRDTLMNNRGIQELSKRLTELENRKIVSRGSTDDIVGAGVRKDLIQNSIQDSLLIKVEIKNEEPVALDLKRIMDLPGSKYDFILRPGDIISIPGRLETIRVAGEVTSPLNLRYDKSYTFKNYIDQSGGFLESAKRGRSYVQYPNGRRRGTKRFLFFKFYPRIEPGSTIFVAKKPERAPINFQAIIAAAGSIATLALVVERLAN